MPEALAIARQMDLDLVEVAPLASPPVASIMDYGKFKFDEAQRAKESRRKATNVGIKEMKYRPKIGPGDFDTKTRQVEKFLADGHKVKVTIMFRGREVFHSELGKRILDRIAERVAGVAKIESEARLDGRNMVMVLAPDKRARQSQAAKTAQGGSGEPVSADPAGGPTTSGPTTSGPTTDGPTADGPTTNGAAPAPQMAVAAAPATDGAPRPQQLGAPAIGGAPTTSGDA